MKVYEYLNQTPSEALILGLLECFDFMNERDARRLVGEKEKIVQAIQVRDDIVGIRVAKVGGLGKEVGPPNYEVYGVDKNGEEVSIVLAPWGYVNHLEVTPDPELDQEHIAALLLFELTYQGDDEDKVEFKHKLEEQMNQPMIELKPGFMVTPNVMEELEKHPELKKIIDGMSVEDFKNRGRRGFD